MYGAQARSCAQYLRKGSRVFVDAELDWREWTDQQDNKREAVTFRARQVLFEGGRPPSVAADEAREQNGAPTGETERSGDRSGWRAAGLRARRAPTTCRSDTRSLTDKRGSPPAAKPAALPV